MLRVTTIHTNTAGPSARYYTRYLADDGPQGEGQWLGRQAAGLGLSGSVSTEELEALLSGHDPVTGALLGNALVDRINAKGKLIPAVASFDATFSAPKSLSQSGGASRATSACLRPMTPRSGRRWPTWSGTPRPRAFGSTATASTPTRRGS